MPGKEGEAKKMVESQAQVCPQSTSFKQHEALLLQSPAQAPGALEAGGSNNSNQTLVSGQLSSASAEPRPVTVSLCQT